MRWRGRDEDRHAGGGLTVYSLTHPHKNSSTRLQMTSVFDWQWQKKKKKNQSTPDLRTVF